LKNFWIEILDDVVSLLMGAFSDNTMVIGAGKLKMTDEMAREATFVSKVVF
jgi:hypothetical protein